MRDTPRSMTTTCEPPIALLLMMFLFFFFEKAKCHFPTISSSLNRVFTKVKGEWWWDNNDGDGVGGLRYRILFYFIHLHFEVVLSVTRKERKIEIISIVLAGLTRDRHTDWVSERERERERESTITSYGRISSSKKTTPLSNWFAYELLLLTTDSHFFHKICFCRQTSRL